MLVKITHPKTPWPDGSVVSVPYDRVPSWLVGKCEPAELGAKAEHVMERPQEQPAGTKPGPQSLGDEKAADKPKK